MIRYTKYLVEFRPSDIAAKAIPNDLGRQEISIALIIPRIASHEIEKSLQHVSENEYNVILKTKIFNFYNSERSLRKMHCRRSNGRCGPAADVAYG
jgi:hypothetical protein